MRSRKVVRAAAAALMCLAVAGCTGMYPGDTEDSNTHAFADRPASELWNMGYGDATGGLANTGTGNVAYNQGYQAGLASKNNPLAAKPPNPYLKPPSLPPSGTTPPSASGGG